MAKKQSKALTHDHARAILALSGVDLAKDSARLSKSELALVSETAKMFGVRGAAKARAFFDLLQHTGK